MQTKEVKVLVYEYDSISELSESDRKLILEARQSVKNAYAPYSGFHVGSALLLANGEVLRGNNQENSTYTVGLCAERVVLFYANANFSDIEVKSLAVSAKNEKGEIPDGLSPCGSCRQVLFETEIRFKKSIRIILDGENKIQVFNGVESLLPFAFKPDLLE